MKKNNNLYLEDRLEAIDRADEYVSDLTYEEFYENNMAQDAVIRQISIIGEALNKVDKEFHKEYPQLPSRDAISMRNVLVHDYDAIDLNRVWATVKDDLPKLKEMIVKILKPV